MMRITSKSNERLKLLRTVLSSRKHRRVEGLFAVEGIRALREALAMGARPHQVFLREDPRCPDEVAALASQLARVLPSSSMAAVAGEALDGSVDVAGSVDVVALFPTDAASFTDLAALAACRCVVVAEGLSDPGNLGTLMRTALAAGDAGLVMVGACVDALAPKVVRSAAGALFGLPMAIVEAPSHVRTGLGMARHLGAAAGEGMAWDQVDLCGPVALWFGDEAHGLSTDARDVCDGLVHIPISPESDSLNVAVAAAILTFEHVRQRRIVRP